MFEALMAALAYWVLLLVHRFGANGMAERPIVAGPVIGLLLGDVVTGTIIGAQLEVIYLGIVSVGGAQATDTLYATIMAVALTIISGIPQDAAITLGIALGFIGLFILQITRIFFAFMCPVLDKIAVEGNCKKYSFAYLTHIIVGYGFAPITIFIVLLAGSGAAELFIETLPPYIMKGMQAAGNMLPALGLGILLSMIWEVKKILYFLLGFVLVVYLKVPMIGLAVIGAFLMFVNFENAQQFNSLRKLIFSNKGNGVSELSDEEEFFN